MPTGGWQTIPFVLKNIAPLAWTGQFPKRRVLDVGVGAGRWGFLFRDCMEFRADRYFKKDWCYQIEGIEVCEAYRNPLWEYAYDRIDIGPIQEWILDIERREKYEIIFFMDVIEHLPKEIGQDILDRLLKRTTKRLILSFPDGNSKHALTQGAVHGNEFERHVSCWTVDELVGKYNITDRVENSGVVISAEK